MSAQRVQLCRCTWARWWPAQCTDQIQVLCMYDHSYIDTKCYCKPPNTTTATQPQQKLKQPALHSPSFKHLEAVKCLLFRACVFSRGGAFWCFWHCLHFRCSWCFCGVKSIWCKCFWCQCRLVPRVFGVKTCKKVWFEVWKVFNLVEKVSGIRVLWCKRLLP